MERDKHLNDHFKGNTVGISLVEFFWGLGLPLILESAFIQILLHTLGASGVVIGAVPAIFFIGQALSGVFSSYFFSGAGDRRRVVILSHLIPPLFLFLYGLILYVSGFNNASVALFLIFYTLLCISFGFILPLWQNYTVVIFSRERVLKALSVMRFLQTLGKLLGSFLLAAVIRRLDVTASSSALVFIACALVFAGSSFFFLMTRDESDKGVSEGADTVRESRTGFFYYLKNTLGEIVRNRQFLYYLGSDLEFLAVITVVSFYAAYGLEFAGFSPALAAGGLMAVNIAGQFSANLLLGMKRGAALNRQAWISKGSAAVGLISLIFLPGVAGVMIAGYFLGYSRGVRGILFPPAVRQLSRRHDSTAYFALAPVIVLPAAGLLPILAGLVLDSLSPYGADAYRILFGLLGFLVLGSGFFLKKAELE